MKPPPHRKAHGSYQAISGGEIAEVLWELGHIKRNSSTIYHPSPQKKPT